MPYGTVDHASQFASRNDPSIDRGETYTMKPDKAHEIMFDMAGEIADFIVALGDKRIARGFFSREELIGWLHDTEMLDEAAAEYLSEAAAEWGES